MTARRLLPLALIGLFALTLLPAEAPAGKVYEIKFGTLAPEDTPWSDVLFAFKEKVEAESNGQIQVKVWLNGALGDEKAMLQKMRFGQLNGGGFSTGGISTIVPELQILELPFLFESHAEADYVMDEVIRDDLVAALAAKDLHLWIWAENGWLDFGGSKPILTPADLASSKVAMQESTVQLSMYEALGVKATPLPVPEILGALQTGMVDAYSGTPIFSTAAQWFAYTEHWTDTNHVYQPAAVVFSKRFWDDMPSDLQEIVTRHAAQMQTDVREGVREIDPELIEGFKENGISVSTWTPAQRQTFRDMAWKSHQDLVQRGAFSQALLDKTYAALESYRASH